MISIEKAMEIYYEKFPNRVITGVLDVGDEFVFKSTEKDGEMIYASPIAINKENGAISSFFPPMNREKLKNAKEVTITPK